jgi:hypothetical protein
MDRSNFTTSQIRRSFFLPPRFFRGHSILRSVLVTCMTAAWACPAPAGNLESRAQMSAIADAGTTLGALALGASESNPLGLAVLVLKLPMLSYVAALPEHEQADGYAMQASIWGAAAVNNVCVAGAIVSGGSFAPLCLVAGAVWGIREWSQSSMEREFWGICRQWRETRPQMKCTYTQPPDRGQSPPTVQAVSLDGFSRNERVVRME